MKTIHSTRLPVMLLIAVSLGGIAALTSAQTDDEILESARSVIRADRQEVVTKAMQFTETEALAFWPLYHQYRAEMNTVGDGIQHLVLEYAGLYPNVPEDRAKTMLKDLARWEKHQVATRAKYLKKVGKVLPAAKTLRFAQVEARLDLAVRLEMAAGIPLVPITGEIAGYLAEGAVVLEGTAGGVYVQTLEITAKVAAIDTVNRKVTLVSPEGIKQVVRVGPDAINFDQIRVGDQLKITATEELIVQMGEKDDVDAGGALIVLAPRGAKPGGVITEVLQITGTVTAIDAANRTVTLKFGDGTTRTFPVRRDVDLGRRQVGEKVLFQIAEMVAIKIGTP